MQYIIGKIKEEIQLVLKKKYAIAFFISCLIIVGVVNTVFMVILSVFGLSIYIYYKDVFNYKKAKEYFTNKNKK
ncbi:hypothetical protein fh0823_15230 [Francisella halioticida]|uniref:Uncharacterized protein n=1 Tax=Francisella halioticida TaxID=549298 RepID=A0ABN5B1S9_9GAMM|nr:hypothetical protein [Francisella halioticida]ASG68493.1 hypothetical protein CDV26_08915 [Francisella halioticida]BCD91384.1 hypothetical protein fh0823_15230 [Francisella halioticida]